MASGTKLEFERAAGSPFGVSPRAGERLAAAIDQAIDSGVNHLLSLQAQEGYWVGELEADTTLESDYILYLHVLGRADAERVGKLANYVRRRQLTDGGWNIYFSGPAELNATVKAYFALKLAGDSPTAEHMQRARARVHELGGLEASQAAGVASGPGVAVRASGAHGWARRDLSGDDELYFRPCSNGLLA